MKTLHRTLVALLLLLASSARSAAQPCRPYVPPIRSTAISIVVSVNGWTGYTDDLVRTVVRAELNARSLDANDGNTFDFADVTHGQLVNLYLTYSIQNDGRDHFAGSVELAGWGQGFITRLTRDQWYDGAMDLLGALAADVYGYLHTGWHDPRPGCPQS